MKNETTGKIYLSEEDKAEDQRQDTLEMCRKYGFDVAQHEGTETELRGKHSSAEVVEVSANGSWEYRDSSGDEVVKAEGANAYFLRLFFYDKESYIAVSKKESQ